MISHSGKHFIVPLNPPAPPKKPYIYKKTLGTLGTLGTAPVSPVVIGFVGTHTQIFTWVPVGTALLFRT